MTEKKIRAGITIGDLGGIGIEVILKTLINPFVMELCTPIVYASVKTMHGYRKLLGMQDLNFHLIPGPQEAREHRANLINCWEEEVPIELGKETDAGGQYALKSLEMAAGHLQDHLIDVIVTAPIHKHNMAKAGFTYPGHTEYFQHKAGASDSLMLLVSENLRIAVATGHIPLAKVSSALTEEVLAGKLTLLQESLKKDFWIEKPKIAVLGLNPHAGEDGSIGEEESLTILPAIKKAKEKGMLVFGPFPADGFFGKSSYTHYDAVLAMYHDQGLIPFKQIAFHHGVNFTAGLPFIRTSPDHGTAFDIAGKNVASETSFLEALVLACDLFKNRSEQAQLKENPLRFSRFTKDRD